MDIQKQQQNKKEGKVPAEGKLKQEGKGDLLQAKQQQVLISPPSPPSATSSPSHEFSFTISLHTSSTQLHNDKTRSHHPSFAIDLSPADEIFFHGHLLPLHLLSHLPVSPRSSTNSLDSFTLPIKELMEEQIPNKGEENCSTSHKNIESQNNQGSHHQRGNSSETNGRSKHKSFSIFGWRKGCEVRDKAEDKEKHKRKLSFDVSQVLKKYARMVRPLLFFRGRRENVHFQRQAYSFSDSLSWRNRQELIRGRRGEFSAPASMRTSPGNSGLLLPLPSSTSDSTMEELQAAIQAAIAHCKNSIATEDKMKCQTT